MRIDLFIMDSIHQDELKEVKGEEDLAKVMQRMKEHLPLSVTVHNTLDMIICGKISEAVVLVPSKDDTLPLCLILQDVVDFTIVALYCCPERKEDFHRIILSSSLIPWTPSIVFIFIIEPLMDTLLKVCEERRTVRRHVKAPMKSCPVFFPPKEGFQGDFSPPPGYELEKIRHEDLQIVLDNWPFNSVFDIELLKKRCVNYDSLALYFHDGEKQEIAAWVLEDDLGAVGKLHTMPNHRRKGLAKILLANFASSQMKNGKIPYSIVDVDNVASKSLFQSLKYERDFNVGFIHAWPSDEL